MRKGIFDIFEPKFRLMQLFQKTLIFVFVILASSVRSQDINLSQYQSSPLNLNPALTGVMPHTSRVVLNYRSQWASFLGQDGFNTLSASYDKQLEVGRDDYMGIGGVIYGDIAGEARLATIFGGLSASYTKKLADNRSSSQHLTGGVNIGFGQRSINEGNLRWPSQFVGGRFVGGDGIQLEASSTTFLDASAGLLWHYSFNNSAFHLGVSAAHLNEPEVSFLNQPEAKLARRLLGHVGAELELRDQLYLMPFGLYSSQGETSSILAGSTVRLLLESSDDHSQALDFGLYGRIVSNYQLSDANAEPTKASGAESLIFLAKLSFSNVAIGFSYDYNISPLEAVSRGHGAFEISLQYFGSNGVTRPTGVPRF